MIEPLLSGRETEVLALLVDGMSINGVALLLGLPETTARSIASSLLDKLRLSSGL